jgi:ribosome-binding factor A
MPREFNRSDRIASQIQKEMADIIRQTIRDTRLGMVTVSEVSVTRDLAVASVYVTFLGGSETASRCARILMEEHAPDLRRELGRRIRIRNLPELRFIYDTSLEQGIRMDALLDHLHE